MIGGMNDQMSRVAMMSGTTEVIDVIKGLKIIIMTVATGNMIGIDSSTGHAMNVAIATDTEQS